MVMGREEMMRIHTRKVATRESLVEMEIRVCQAVIQMENLIQYLLKNFGVKVLK